MEAPALEPPSYEALQAENLALRAENAVLCRQVADLTAKLDEIGAKLEAALAEIERLKRSGKRQATPFSKGEHKSDPQRPGRKPREGPFRCRTAPSPAPGPQAQGRPLPLPHRARPGGDLRTCGPGSSHRG